MIELKFSLQPKQQVLLNKMETTPVLFYGGAKGGGKSRGMRDVFLIRRFKYERTTAAIFRQTYPELEGNHIAPLFKNYPDLRQYYNESKKKLSLPNGSSLEFCYAKSDADLANYQGREWDDLGIEEAGQWRESMFRTLHGSNRTATPGVHPRCLLTGNPGGIGHGWLKRIFVERRFNERELPQDYDFIQATVDDNPALMENDPAYVRRLDAEPNDALRRAYRWGDWDIFAGQFFQEIHRDIHFIDPFPIPTHWNRFGAYDFGFNHPGAFGWFANNEDGDTFLYREFIKAGLRVDEFASELNKFEDTSRLYPIVAGHDCWAKRQAKINKKEVDPPTIAEEFKAHGIVLKQAVLDRIAGAAQLRSYLAWKGKRNKKPRLFIFKSCPITFDALTRMIVDPDRPEDVLKVDATEGDPMTGDDPYDILRYGMMSRPRISDPLPKNYVPGTKEHSDHMAAQLFENTVSKLEKDKKQQDGEGFNWNLDNSGVPSWNKW